MLRHTCLSISFLVAVLSSIWPLSVGRAADSFLFERDGFRIHYVGNGGNCNGCEWIAVDGNIPPDAGQIFQQYVVRHNFTGISLYVTFNSNGGSLVGGIRLGRVIRSLGMNTSIGKTMPNDRWHKTEKGVCFSACAYAFLGGVQRLVRAGEYGVHQFFTDALLKDPNGKVFSPADFSVQQTVTGLLLSYVIEMGASAELVVEANKTPPTEMAVLTQERLTNFRVAFDPKRYGDWKLEAHRSGLLAFSRTQDEKSQMTIFCDASGRSKLLITYSVSVDGRDEFRKAFNVVQKFSLLKRDIARASIRLENYTDGVRLHVPLSTTDLNDLEANADPYGSFSVHMDEPRVHYGLAFEQISLRGLSASVRLVRRNCIN